MAQSAVASVNVGAKRRVTFEGPRSESAIDKRPVTGAVYVGSGGVEGDTQVDRLHHGGPDQALYAYSTEDLAWWSQQLGRTLSAGAFGENLSTVRVDTSGCLVGEIWRIGEVVVQVTSPRLPCRTFAGWMDEDHWMKRFADAGRPGAYLRVLAEGRLAAGDPVRVVERPAQSVSVAEAMQAYYGDGELLPRLLRAPALSSRWVAMARQRITEGTLCRLPDNQVSNEDGRESRVAHR